MLTRGNSQLPIEIHRSGSSKISEVCAEKLFEVILKGFMAPKEPCTLGFMSVLLGELVTSNFNSSFFELEQFAPAITDRRC